MTEPASRTKKSILNIGSNFIIYFIKTILSFVVRTFFIKILGETYLGANGLLTNVLSMLSLAELGISTTINFSLYKPLAEKDYDKVSSLMSFYRRAYRAIGIIVAVLGMILYFFLDTIIKDPESIQNLHSIYLLYLINAVSTYFISYKETLINADQKAYRLTMINFVCTVILYLAQLAVLVIFKNFIVYLIAQFIVEFIQRVIVNRYITKQYSFINFVSDKKLDRKTLNEITTNIKALIYHKIGDYCTNSTDNIIISKYIGIDTVGYYSNYQTIIKTILTLTNMFYTGLTASLGNLVAIETAERKAEITQKLDFIGFFIYSTCTVLLFYLFNPFIELWIGKNFVLPIETVILIVINFYFTCMMLPIVTVKNSAGLYKQDRYSPIIRSIINIVLSIVLAQYIGLNGVIIGTLVSGFLPCIQRPYIVYKYLLKQSAKKYYISYIKYIIVILISMAIIYVIKKFIIISNLLMYLVIMAMIIVVVHLLVITIVYRKTNEYLYILDFVKKVVKKK